MHVNAFFELSSNRRDIWYGTDMAGMGAARAQWNLTLLEAAVAPAWVELLSAAAATLGATAASSAGAGSGGPGDGVAGAAPGGCGPSAAYSRLWPVEMAQIAQPWRAAAAALYRCAAGGGKAVAWTAASGGFFLPLSECLFPDATVAGSPPLAAALVKLGLPLLTMPRGIAEPLAAAAGLAAAAQQAVSPALARRYASQQPGIGSALERSSELVALLDYCTSDLDVSSAASASQAAGLQLLPLRDGAVGSLQRAPAASTGANAAAAAAAHSGASARGGQRFYLPSELEVEVFGQLAGRLVETAHLSAHLLARLTALAKLQVGGVMITLVPHVVIHNTLHPLAIVGLRLNGSRTLQHRPSCPCKAHQWAAGTAIKT